MFKVWLTEEEYLLKLSEEGQDAHYMLNELRLQKACDNKEI